jgi:hypothetical protein
VIFSECSTHGWSELASAASSFARVSDLRADGLRVSVLSVAIADGSKAMRGMYADYRMSILFELMY